MLDDVDYDDGEAPAIGLVGDVVAWADVQDHIKISHSPLLVRLEGSAEYAGVYWTGTRPVVTEDLGPDHDQAIVEFREILRERGEA